MMVEEVLRSLTLAKVAMPEFRNAPVQPCSLIYKTDKLYILLSMTKAANYVTVVFKETLL